MVDYVSSPIWTSLPAEGPHPLYQEQLKLFGRFIGVWDLDVRFLDRTGKTIAQGPAEWSFGWILDGRAIQDVLVFERGGGWGAAPDERGIGTTVRYYDPRQNTWRIVWLGAVSGVLVVLNGRVEQGEILVEGTDVDGSHLRWMFTDITDQSFHWKGFSSEDGHTGWWMEQEMVAKRRSDPTLKARA